MPFFALLRLSILLALLTLFTGCGGGSNEPTRLAPTRDWRFELKGSPTLITVGDVEEIRRRVLSQAYNRTQIVQMLVVSSDEVWVRRGRRYGGVAEYWKRDERNRWRRAVPAGYTAGWTMHWRRGSE